MQMENENIHPNAERGNRNAEQTIWSIGVLGGSFAASLVISHRSLCRPDPCVRPKVVHGLQTVL